MEYEERESEFDIEDEDKSEPEQTGTAQTLPREFPACLGSLGPVAAWWCPKTLEKEIMECEKNGGNWDYSQLSSLAAFNASY